MKFKKVSFCRVTNSIRKQRWEDFNLNVSLKYVVIKLEKTAIPKAMGRAVYNERSFSNWGLLFFFGKDSEALSARDDREDLIRREPPFFKVICE